VGKPKEEISRKGRGRKWTVVIGTDG